MEFLPYPHLIPTLFNGCGFGPPPPFTAASAWTWIDHTVSGLPLPTLPPSGGAALLTPAFTSAPLLLALNHACSGSSPDRSTKSTRLHMSPYASTACKHRDSGSLSLPSRGPFHLSFTVLYSIGHWGVFSLAGWSPLLPARFPVSRSTPDSASFLSFTPTGLSPSPARLPRRVPLPARNAFGSPYPGMLRIPVWALPIPLAATLGITFVFFSSGYLDVSVRRVPPACLWIQHAVRRLSLRGFPHSDTCGSLRMCRSPQLFAAYRVFLRLPVPGHPPCALFCLAIRPAFGAA